jgi:hypothetical protein
MARFHDLSRVEDCSVQGSLRQGTPALPACGNREQMYITTYAYTCGAVQRLVQSNHSVARDSMHTIQSTAGKGKSRSDFLVFYFICTLGNISFNIEWSKKPGSWVKGNLTVAFDKAAHHLQ